MMMMEVQHSMYFEGDIYSDSSKEEAGASLYKIFRKKKMSFKVALS